MKRVLKVISIIGNLILGILLLVGLIFAFSLLPFKSNYKIYAVMSGSMEPKIKTGSIVFSKPAVNYRENDIVTFFSKTDKKETTTHRIIGKSEQNGQAIFETKGDANPSVDSNKLNEKDIVGREFLSIPYIGYPLRYIKTLPGLLLIIIIPSTIMIYEETRKIHREVKAQIEQRRKKKKTRGKI